MSFDYDKIAVKQNEHASWWTSYADLFMMLSIVFLLMYVASALRNGTASFQQQTENRKLAQKAEGLEQQIKVYNTLKDESLRKEATESERQVYQKLMSKLSLLRDEAREEKDSLRQKAKENEEKEFALNQYQQLVSNIINANILAKSQIHHRDDLIVTKDATIEEKKKQITGLEQTLAENERQITDISSRLDAQIAALRQEQERSQSSKQELERKITSLRQRSATQIQAIEDKKRAVAEELGQVRSTLANTESQLTTATGTIQQQEQELGALSTRLSAEKERYAEELGDLKQEHARQLAAERRAFMGNLKKQKLSADARARKIARFALNAQKKAGALEGELSGLKNKIAATDSKLKGAQAQFEAAQNQLAGTQNQLAGAQNQLAGAQNQLAGTQNQLAGAQKALVKTEGEKRRALAAVEGLEGDLAKTRAIANARKELAAAIASHFARSGIKGAVDARTGEVTLDFGGEYFETGSTQLKPRMKATLDKFIPIYARSLFTDPKLASKIANVEIVGFASSTYKGRYVNPKSADPKDKEAVEYNLKLSFGRANSIFKHMLNQNKLTKAERDRLLPLMKVAGRGYLPEGVSAEDLPDDMSERDFCQKYNCRKAQKVTVKFNMKD